MSRRCLSTETDEENSLTTFPKDFHWGAATAAYQVEGGNVYGDQWSLENVPGTMFAEPAGDACDHYHRFREDIALLAAQGLNMYRFSIEWARIEPEEGMFSAAEIGHYRRVIECCVEHGVTPMVTFHHFTSPRWVTADGGWEGDKTPERFARYCGFVAEQLSGLIPYALTINELSLPRLLVHAEGIPLDKPDPVFWAAAANAIGTEPGNYMPFLFASSEKARDTMLTAHKAGTTAIKAADPECLVGCSIAMTAFESEPGGEEQMASVRRIVEDEFLEHLGGDDFVGVQNYHHVRYGPEGRIRDPDAILSQLGQEFAPHSLGATIRRAADVTGLPIIVTENGFATEDDALRIRYLTEIMPHLDSCIDDGIDLRGYVHWSLMDNFEWIFGYMPKYGLLAVDRATQERTVKPSFGTYRELIAERAGSSG
jgi:beta-glucosidase